MSIYVFKAARRPTYRRENLHLLSADRGTIVDVQYRLSWVASEYFEPGSIRRGEEVHVLFTDRPYDRFVPVRAGEVFDVIRGDGIVRIRVLVNNWISAPPDITVDDFTRIVKQTHPEKAPRHKFLAPKLDRIAFVEYFDEREDEGWCRAVDEVCNMSERSTDKPYAASVFFRSLGVRLDGEDAPVSVRTRSLEPGSRGALELRFYNPHLESCDAAELRLEAAAAGDLTITPSEHITLCGSTSIPIAVHSADAEVLIQVGPAVTQHTYLVEKFGGARRMMPTAAEQHDVPRRRDLLDLVDFVVRNTRFVNSGDGLDFWQLVGRMLPSETTVAAQRAMAVAAAGKRRQALEILRELPTDELCDETSELLWDLEFEENDDDAADRAQMLGLLDDPRFERFLARIEGMEPRRLAAFVPRLAELVPEDEALRHLIERVACRITSPDALAQIAETIAYKSGDARWGFEFLRDRQATLHLNDPVVLDQLWNLVELSGADELPPEMEKDEVRRITNLLVRDEIENVLERLERHARSQAPAQRRMRDQLFEHAAKRLDERGRSEEAAQVMVKLGLHACRSGDLEVANKAIGKAIGFWTTASSGKGHVPSAPPTWLQEAREVIESAWREVEGLEEWRRTAEERRRHELRGCWKNKRILIAGGFKQCDIIDYVEDMTGAKVDWCERYRNEGSDMHGYATRLANGNYALVIYMLTKTGHETAEILKAAAERGGARWENARSCGKASVLECIPALN